MSEAPVILDGHLLIQDGSKFTDAAGAPKYQLIASLKPFKIFSAYSAHH